MKVVSLPYANAVLLRHWSRWYFCDAEEHHDPKRWVRIKGVRKLQALYP